MNIKVLYILCLCFIIETVAVSDLIIIQRELYALSPKYRKVAITSFSVAQLVYEPFYISLESALSVYER